MGNADGGRLCRGAGARRHKGFADRLRTHLIQARSRDTPAVVQGDCLERQFRFHLACLEGVIRHEGHAVALGRSPEEISAQLEREITPVDIRMWQMGSGLDWAIESFRIASGEIYGKLSGPGGTDAPIILPQDYVAAESVAVRQQLEKAGVRLAWVLNEALR